MPHRTALRITRLAGLTLLFAGAAIACAYGLDHAKCARILRRVQSPQAEVRRDAFEDIARERPPSLVSAVRAAIGQEQDRDALAWAACALTRVGDRSDVALLLDRAGTLPGDETHAKLLLYAAKLSGRDIGLVGRMLAETASNDDWRRAGGAIGLLEIGDPRGGPILLEVAGRADAAAATFAASELRRIAEPMAQITGRQLVWREQQDRPTPECVADVKKFWQNTVDARLLGDVLDRLSRPDPDWREVNRLLHARERVARWLVGTKTDA